MPEAPTTYEEVMRKFAETEQRAREIIARAEAVMADRRPADAHVLRHAAVILRSRSKKPTGFWLGVMCRFLLSVAEDIEKETEA
jgi:hypothetical protein